MGESRFSTYEEIVFFTPRSTPPPLLSTRSLRYMLYLSLPARTSLFVIAGYSQVSVSTSISELLSSRKEQIVSRLGIMLLMLVNDIRKEGVAKCDLGFWWCFGGHVLVASYLSDRITVLLA